LHALASLVRENPASPRARVVLRVLIALRDKAGEFEEKDLWALDAEAQQLLTALVSDQLAGRYFEAEFAALPESLASSRPGGNYGSCAALSPHLRRHRVESASLREAVGCDNRNWA
jgi:hypothetical protein